MIFSWLKRRRRAKLLAEPFSHAWLDILDRNVWHYRLMNSAEKARLRDDLRVIVAEKNWEGCGGLALTDEIKVTVAGQAAVMLLGLEHDYFDRVLSILVYPTGYVVPPQNRGSLLETATAVPLQPRRTGEAWYRGPVILSWADVLRDSTHPGRGRNLVWHEFAHQLDMLDREVDGTPPLSNLAQYKRWREVMSAEFDRLVEDVESGRPTLLDPYGTSNEGEFFAVSSECFFDRPVELSDEHPELYELLRDYYRQDPARRVLKRNVGPAY